MKAESIPPPETGVLVDIHVAISKQILRYVFSIVISNFIKLESFHLYFYKRKCKIIKQDTKRR